jgi:hypothetical protein
MTPIRLAALAALVLTAVLAATALRPAPAHGDAVPVSDKGVVVTGTGSVAAVPDRGAYSFAVSSPGRTAVVALRANAAAIAEVVAALRRAGIAAADLQTTQSSLEQRRSEDGQTTTGYLATSSVLAQLRALARAGAVVDAAVAAGADSFAGPSLSTGDTSRFYDEARKRAVADARAKAQLLAAAAGLTLGRVTSIQEGGAQATPLVSSAKADSAQIEPGTQEIQATVTVAFAAA